ncbi:MAG: exodeoxyribonuclease VII small subunit [candidate division WOR-3 bacterium]
MAGKKKTEEVSFERSLAELESIVRELETGNLSLDRSLELFQRGVELARDCKQKLDAAELKLTQLIKQKDELFKEELVPDTETPEAEQV